MMIIFKRKSKEKKGRIFIKFIRITFIILIFINHYFSKNISTFMSKLNYIKECNNIEDYLKFCNSQLIKLKKIKKYKNPKISIVSPIYNRGNYVQRFIKSIQNQNFKDIEIILIDDCSNDNTYLLVNNYSKLDNRIILIKNKKNKGTFASRNLGSLVSKGEYIILPDPDDILEKNCLHYFYNLAKKNDYELIRFYIYQGKRKIFFGNHIINLPSKIIYQPELSTYLFYASKRVYQIDFNVSNKFIKREVLIRVLNCISNYMFIYMNIYEDGILNYFLYFFSKSFFFAKKISYYYIINPHSITTKKFKKEYLKCIFWHLKFVFEFSKNKKYTKEMSNVLFKRIGIGRNIIKIAKYIRKDFNFFIDIIDEFLMSEFINNKNKKYILKIKKIIIKQRRNFFRKNAKLIQRRKNN